MEKKGYVYLMTNKTNTVLYTGVTNSLKRRILEHAEGGGSFFTAKFKCKKLVYFETFPDIEQAIAREKRIKTYSREWKNNLIGTVNPQWEDLSKGIIIDPSII